MEYSVSTNGTIDSSSTSNSMLTSDSDYSDSRIFTFKNIFGILKSLKQIILEKLEGTLEYFTTV